MFYRANYALIASILFTAIVGFVFLLRVCVIALLANYFSPQVDLIVVGSVAVSEKGYRIGKGEGFADMEWGMMATMGAVRADTIVVTIVHDCQVVGVTRKSTMAMKRTQEN